VLVRADIGGGTPAVLVADQPVRATHAGIRTVPEELELLPVPRLHAAQRKRSGGCGVVSGAALSQRPDAVLSQHGHHWRDLTPPVASGRSRYDLERCGRGRRCGGCNDHELPARRMPAREQLRSHHVALSVWGERDVTRRRVRHPGGSDGGGGDGRDGGVCAEPEHDRRSDPTPVHAVEVYEAQLKWCARRECRQTPT
jgi:hypothetical protein